MSATYDPKNMIFRNLGNSGLRVSALSFGGFTLKEGVDVVALLDTAFKHGINTFDTAEAYSKGESETVLGKAIRQLGWKREEIVLTTKIFFGTGLAGPNARGLSRKHIIEGTDASLERAGLEYWDVIHTHRFDSSVPMEEIVRAFNHLIDTGRCFYWATSMWTAQQIEEAHGVAKRLGLIPPIADQPEYNLLCRDKVEKEYLALYRNYGWGLTTYSPLASGLLTGKYNEKIPEDSRFNAMPEFFKDTVASLKTPEGVAKIEKIKKLTAIADELGSQTSTLALAWCLKNPNVSTVILGATKTAQLEENLKALEIYGKLDDALMQRIDTIMANKPSPDSTYGR